uniref:VQ domain-containing protein n=1 Tax=Parastrongyloides trichosuri TaxID=131310 RepID=A0A0N4Z5L1_PARTI
MNRFQTAFLHPNGTYTNTQSPPSYKVALLQVLKMNDKNMLKEKSKTKDFHNSNHDNLISGRLPEYLEKFILAGTRSDNMIDQSQSVAIDEFKRNSGEIDMLIGFLVMNGACIVFFLLFGLCVIFNCMRRKPKIFSQDKIYKKTLAKTVAKAPSNPKVTLLPKDAVVIDVQSNKFKDLVNKVMKSDEFEKMKSTTDTSKNDTPIESDAVSLKNSEQIINRNINYIKNDNVNQRRGLLRSLSKSFKQSIRSNSILTHNSGKRGSLNIECGDKSSLREINNSPHRQNIHFIDSTDTNNHVVVADQTSSSLIRQNIFGPLSFDDLYYM